MPLRDRVALLGWKKIKRRPDPFSGEYLDDISALLLEVGAPYYSDHICYSAIAGAGFYDLLPLPFVEAAAQHIGRRARELSAALGFELVLENISYYAQMPGSEFNEGAFVTRALEAAGARLLLDLNNVYVNARNHGLDTESVLGQLPLHRTRHVHLAGQFG